MKEKKCIVWLIMIINAVGVVCLIFFAVLYLTHDITVAHPDAMLPMEAWDSAGMALTFGFIPLLIANILGGLFVKVKQKYVKFLFFIPSMVCLVIVISYWAQLILK